VAFSTLAGDSHVSTYAVLCEEPLPPMPLKSEGDAAVRISGTLSGLGIALALATPSQLDAAEPKRPGPAEKNKALLPLELPQLREQRKTAARRKRRIIFNNDGDDACYYNQKGTPEALLEVRTTPLLGSQVDTIFYSTASCFPSFTHNTKVGEVFTCRENKYENNSVPALIALGTDPLHIMVDFCRKNRIEVFWSLRMNDTHDASSAWYGPLLFSRFKKEHPEFITGSREKHPKHGAWSSADYTRPEVRDMCFRIIEEVCQNYDIDGIELDFFRHACFFKRVAWGEAAGAEELAMMTGLIRRVRDMTEREGMKRGRPILVTARVPDSLEFAKGIGLDVEQWLSEGMLDMLVTTGYFRLNHWTYSVDLGHRFGVPVYPCLSDSRVRGETGGYKRRSIEGYRARAAQAWQAGADGIYLFNLFNPRLQHWGELGEPATLDGRDKLYFATFRDGNAGSYLPDGNASYRVPVIVPRNPRTVTSGTSQEVEIVVAEGLMGTGGTPSRPAAACHVRLGKPEHADRLLVSLNDRPLGKCTIAGAWLSYPVAPEILLSGVNRVRLSVAAGRPSEPDAVPGVDEWDVDWPGSELATYPERQPWRSLVECADYVEEVRGACLFLADRSASGNDMANLIYPWHIDPQTETVVDVRVKVVNSDDPLGVCVRVANGTTVEYLTLGSKSIGLHFAGLTEPFDTTSTFHTYRIAVKKNDIRVSVDGRLMLDGSGRFTASARDKSHWLPLVYGLAGWNNCSLAFGSATGPGTGAAMWEFVRFRSATKTVFVKDMAISVTYPKAKP
jgi:hypothetical protein